MCLLNQLNAGSFLNLLLFFIILIKSVSLDQNVQIAIKSIILFCWGKRSSFIYTILSKDKKILKKVWEEFKITTKIEEEGGGLEPWPLSHIFLSVIVFTLELTEVNMTCIRSTQNWSLPHPVTESGGNLPLPEDSYSKWCLMRGETFSSLVQGLVKCPGHCKQTLTRAPISSSNTLMELTQSLGEKNIWKGLESCPSGLECFGGFVKFSSLNHAGWLTVACNFSNRASSGLCRHYSQAQTLTQSYTHT